MRKLPNVRRPGYTQIDNGVFDNDALCVIDMGLLGKLLRCTDGYEITVQAIADRHSDPKRRGTGYAALEAAMRNLVARAYVIKIKYQNRAGHWATTFGAFDTPAEPFEVVALLRTIDDDVVSFKVEPPHLDPRLSDEEADDLRKYMYSTDSALSGSRSAGSRQASSSKEDVSHKTKDQDAAPFGRVSAPDARRASTGSSARATRGASGAADKTGKRARMTKAQTEAFRLIEETLRQTIGGTCARPIPARIPPAPLGNEIREQLTHRTAAQLVARIERRWTEHRWAAKLEGTDPAEAGRSAIGVAIALVRSPECPDAGCEDGTRIDGGPCPTCAEGAEDRRRTRRAKAGTVPHPRDGESGPQTAAQRPACVDCGQTFPATVDVPADGVCGPCHREAARDAQKAAEFLAGSGS